MSEVIAKIKQAVIEMKVADASRLVKEALGRGLEAQELLNCGLIEALKVVGEKFRRDEIFLPEVMLSANAFKAAFEILKPILLSGDYRPRAKVVLGTVAGDVHDIGKNIVAALLEGNGYQIIDLGVNVPAAKFIDAVKKENAAILGLSTLLTTTMPEMARVIEAVKAASLRGRVKIIVGGAAVTREYADQIGADGFGADAQQGVELINRWTETLGSGL